MKPNLNTLIQLAVIAVAIFFSATTSANDIKVRFVQERMDNNHLHVSVEIKSVAGDEIVLAGQNYRFYYNSDVISLKESSVTSTLPNKAYGKATFESHMKNVNAGVGQLTFDHDLGFANFYIELEDQTKGAATIKDGEWTKLVSLTFDVISDGEYNLVWGRENISDRYATAFVEMGAWVSDDLLERTHITDYGDLVGKRESKKISEVATIAVGPNPTIDFVNVTLDEATDAPTKVNVIDINGQVVAQTTIGAGDIQESVDLSQMIAGKYLIEVLHTERGQRYQESVVLAK